MLADAINTLRLVENRSLSPSQKAIAACGSIGLWCSIGMRIVGFDLHRCGFACFRRIPARFRRRFQEDQMRLSNASSTRVIVLLRVVGDFDETCGITRLLECFGDDECHRLHIEEDPSDWSAGKGLGSAPRWSRDLLREMHSAASFGCFRA